MHPKIYIIILNWNGLSDTLECVESLQKIDYPNYEVLIVDNNSSGNDVEIIRERFGDFVKEIIVNEDNLGFSGGNNVGIKSALENDAAYILLLNNDTVVEPDFLSKLVEASKMHPDAGILTPMINYFSSRNTVWFAGGYISKFRSSGFPDGIGKHESNYLIDRSCNFASGCCMYIKKEVIEKIGLFDENYFLYLEDADFSYRAHKKGIKIFYTSSSKIYHKVSATTSKVNSMLTLYYSTRNRLYFAKKNLGMFYYYNIVVYILLISPIKLIFIKQRREVVKTIIKAYKDMFTENMQKGSFKTEHSL